MERPIGQVFADGKHILEVEESTGGFDCLDCHFYNNGCDIKKEIRGECIDDVRSDFTDVKFIKQP